MDPSSFSAKATKEQGKRLEDAPAHKPRRILQQLLDEGVIGSLVSVSSAEVIASRRVLQPPKGRVPLHFQAFCGRVNKCAAAGSGGRAWSQADDSWPAPRGGAAGCFRDGRAIATSLGKSNSRLPSAPLPPQSPPRTPTNPYLGHLWFFFHSLGLSATYPTGSFARWGPLPQRLVTYSPLAACPAARRRATSCDRTLSRCLFSPLNQPTYMHACIHIYIYAYIYMYT